MTPHKPSEALQLRTFFRTGRDLPESVDLIDADTVRRAIRRQGYIPGDVVPEKIADELKWARRERWAGRT